MPCPHGGLSSLQVKVARAGPDIAVMAVKHVRTRRYTPSVGFNFPAMT